MRTLLVAIAVLVASIAPRVTLATAQEPDVLLLDGEVVALQTNPLRPLIQSEVILLPKPDTVRTSNWRGYVATWEVSETRLILKGLTVLLKPEGFPSATSAVATDVLSSVFNGQTVLTADWYSGALVIPRGEVKHYVHMGYGSIYERYTILSIKGGHVVSREDLDADQFDALRRQRFESYTNTSGYAARLKKSGPSLSAEEAKEFIYHYAVEEYMAVEQ